MIGGHIRKIEIAGYLRIENEKKDWSFISKLSNVHCALDPNFFIKLRHKLGLGV